MANSTVYDVRVNYLVHDQASKGTKKIGQTAQFAAKQTGMLSGALQRMLALGAGVFGIRAAKGALVDYTRDLEQAQIQMSGLIQMNMGGSWAKNQRNANKLVAQFINDAKASTATSKDFVDMASRITGPLLRAGGSMKDLREVTKGATIAAKAFGIEGQMASLDIEQALAGTLTKRDRFARALLEPMNMTTEKWNELVKDTPGKAASMLVKAFQQPAVMNMAKEQEKSWAGVTSTLKDNLDRAFAKVGLPLMRKINAEMTRLNKWFAENPKKVAQLIEKMSSGLITAFDYAKRTFAFIERNKTLLMNLAKAYLVGKVAGGLASGIHTVGAGLMALITPLRTSMSAMEGFGSKAALAAGKISSIVGILGGVYMGAKALQGYLEDRQEAEITKKAQVGSDIGRRRYLAFGGIGKGITDTSIKSQAYAQAARYGFSNARQFMAAQIVKEARAKGLISGDSIKKGITGNEIRKAWQIGPTGAAADTYNWDKHEEVLTRALAIDRDRRIMAAAGLGKEMMHIFNNQPERIAKVLDQYTENWFGRLGAWLFPGFADRTIKRDKKTEVKIHKIEVASNDPDRFAFDFVGAMQDIVENPVQARRVLREGGR